ERRPVDNSAAGSDLATTNFAFEAGYVQPIFRQRQYAIPILQSEWEISAGKSGVDYFDLSLNIGIGALPIGIDVEAKLPRGDEVRIKQLNQFQIDGAQCEQRDRSIAFDDRHGCLELQVGVCPA